MIIRSTSYVVRLKVFYLFYSFFFLLLVGWFSVLKFLFQRYDVSSLIFFFFLMLLFIFCSFFLVRSMLWSFKGHELIESFESLIIVRYIIGSSYILQKNEINVTEIESIQIENNLDNGIVFFNIFKKNYGRLRITTIYGKVYTLGQNTTKCKLENSELVQSLLSKKLIR